MGQYYNAVVGNEDTKTYSVFEPDFKKLMEHSWWNTDFMTEIYNQILNKPCRVAWIGDYADEDGDYDRFAHNEENNQLPLSYETAYGKNVKPIYISSKSKNHKFYSNFHLEDYFLVNHSKKEYINLGRYLQNCPLSEDDTLSPLSLLTVIGNDRGGGDYHITGKKPGEKFVGIWAWDVLELVKDISPVIKKTYKERPDILFAMLQ